MVIDVASSADNVLVWSEVCKSLREQHGDDVFNSWFKPLCVAPNNGVMGNNAVTLVAPTRFVRQWVESNYVNDILSLWHKLDSSICGVEIVVAAGSAAPADVAESSRIESVASNSNIADTPEGEFDDGLSLTLDGRFTFDNFVVGKPNEFAFNAIKMVAESEDAVMSSNPLFLRGGVGLGKTHLMHSAAWHIRKNHKWRKVIYLSAEKFMYQFIVALRNKNIMGFKDYFRSADVLLIDDIQFLGGKDGTQEEFFHTFNSLIDNRKQLIISADRPPSELKDIEERIRSRLGGGLAVDVNSTNFELRLGILHSKAKTLPVVPSDDVLHFLAENIRTNVRELEGSLNKVVAHAMYMNKEITVELTEELLADLLRSNKLLDVEDIQKHVAEYYGVRVNDLCSVRRQRNFARPRQVAMYLAKNLTIKSFPDIGRRFGGKDHTTVMHAVKRIDALLKSDKQLYDDVRVLTKRLRGV